MHKLDGTNTAHTQYMQTHLDALDDDFLARLAKSEDVAEVGLAVRSESGPWKWTETPLAHVPTSKNARNIQYASEHGLKRQLSLVARAGIFILRRNP